MQSVRQSIFISLFILLMANIGDSTELTTRLPVDARATGMGQAAVALLNLSDPQLYNPGALAFQQSHQFTIQFSPLYAYENADYALTHYGASYHIHPVITIGVYYLSLNSRTTIPSTLLSPIPEGKYTEENIGLTAAFRISDRLGCGVTLQRLHLTQRYYSVIIPGREFPADVAPEQSMYDMNIGALYAQQWTALPHVQVSSTAGATINQLFGGLDEKKIKFYAREDVQVIRIGTAHTIRYEKTPWMRGMKLTPSLELQQVLYKAYENEPVNIYLPPPIFDKYTIQSDHGFRWGMELQYRETVALRYGEQYGEYHHSAFGIGINLPVQRWFPAIPVLLQYNLGYAEFSGTNQTKWINTHSLSIAWVVK